MTTLPGASAMARTLKMDERKRFKDQQGSYYVKSEGGKVQGTKKLQSLGCF